MLILDISQSMPATDVKPNRLDAARRPPRSSSRSCPTKYNVALVAWPDRPPCWCRRRPPTVQNAIDSIQLQDSTAIGEGIDAAMRRCTRRRRSQTPGRLAPGAIVLLSDGKNTTGRAPLQAAAEAGEAKVPIYTIAYGTENGYVDLDGKREPVPVDKEEMKAIAELSGGEYFAAATADQLRGVYKNIGSDVGYEKADREVTARFAGYGLALAVLAALGAISLGAKWP